jgi:hypothetical protein
MRSLVHVTFVADDEHLVTVLSLSLSDSLEGFLSLSLGISRSGKLLNGTIQLSFSLLGGLQVGFDSFHHFLPAGILLRLLVRGANANASLGRGPNTEPESWC